MYRRSIELKETLGVGKNLWRFHKGGFGFPYDNERIDFGVNSLLR